MKHHIVIQLLTLQIHIYIFSYKFINIRFGIVMMQVLMLHNQQLTNGNHPIKHSVHSSSISPNQQNKYTKQRNQHHKKLKIHY